jgi:hypothetical protein
VTATDFLSVQLFAAIVGLYLCRHLLFKRWLALLRLLLFVAAASYSFDYIANDRGIWEFTGSWHLRVLINPFENTIFSVTMTLQLILLYLVLGSRIPKKNHL